jgi:NADPH:quinone reductase-like Zn-dependent oxidoreductase
LRVARVTKGGGLDNLINTETDEPAAPAAGQIKVRIRANSLNYHDYLVVTGQSRVAEGLVPMSDASGDVIGVGEGVTGFTLGDHVISTFFPNWIEGGPVGGGLSSVPGDGIDGFAQDVVTVQQNAFTHAPTGLSHEEAATLPCAAVTAWRALVSEGHVKAGDAVLVQGTGGVSLFALQLATAMGVTVVATSSSNEKLDRLKGMGAAHLINYRQTERWGSAAKAALGRGVDHVLEVGGAGTLGQSVAACREGAHIAMIGMLTGFASTAPTASIMTKQLRVTGIMVGNRRHHLDTMRGLEALSLRPVIDRTFPIEELADAFRYQETGRHFGKIVITYSE